MVHMSRNLVLFAILFALVAGKPGKPCKFPVPFSSKLVGRTFLLYDDCYRPSTLSNIKIFRDWFTYRPQVMFRFGPIYCEERYVFHFKRGGKVPFVVRFPRVEIPDDLYSDDDKIKAFCKKEQPKLKKRFFPRGKTRKMFKKAVRKIVKGVLEIRDFGCVENQDGLLVQVEGRAFTNADVDGIVTYLLGVGYEYFFCAEPKPVPKSGASIH